MVRVLARAYGSLRVNLATLLYSSSKSSLFRSFSSSIPYNKNLKVFYLHSALSFATSVSEELGVFRILKFFTWGSTIFKSFYFLDSSAFAFEVSSSFLDIFFLIVLAVIVGTFLGGS